MELETYGLVEGEGWLELGSSIDFEILLGLMKLRVGI
jgi:hypothetical protein